MKFICILQRKYGKYEECSPALVLRCAFYFLSPVYEYFMRYVTHSAFINNNYTQKEESEREKERERRH